MILYQSFFIDDYPVYTNLTDFLFPLEKYQHLLPPLYCLYKISNTAFSYFLAVLRKTGGQYRDKQYAWEMEFSHVFSLLL